MMKVITFASSKGGVGKTTLAFNAAIHAAKAQGVLLADLDPQRSLLDLCARRREMPELKTDNPMILENAATVSSAVEVLMQTGYDRDFLLVDTPGSGVNIMRDAIANADVVVVPLQPSPMDLLAQDPVLEMIETHRKRDRLLFVLNRVDRRVGPGLIEGTCKRLALLSSHPIVQIAQRADYAWAGAEARAGVEVNKDAAAEIAVLWNAILAVMRKADERQAGHRRSQAKRARRKD